MSTNALNQVYKTGVLAIEQSAVAVQANAGDTTVNVSGYYMTQTPFVADGRPYIIYDDTFSGGANGVPNCERFEITSISGASATPLADGVGYHYTATLNILATSTTGWTGGLANSYDSSAYVLTPGVEVAIQSSDFNVRFKTLSDTPKIDMDDEASRIASGDEGRDKSIAGARSGEISFTEKMAWAGANTSLPIWDKLMRTMGHVTKKYSGTGIGFLPMIQSNEVTATIWVINPENGYAAGSTVYRYTGAHGGNGSSISAGKIGDPYMITGKYSAAYIGTQELSTAQARVMTSPETRVPEVLLNNTLVVPARVNGSDSSREIEISQFSLDFGGVVNSFIDQNTSTGNAYYVTVDRDPKFTCNPYHVRKSVDDIDYVVTNESTGTLTLKSPATSTHITIELPNAQLLSPSLASREGYVSTSRTYRGLRNNLGNGSVDNTMPDGSMYEILIGSRS